MYCKICGNSLIENAVNCQVCGAPVAPKKNEADATEIIYNSAAKPQNPEFSWNIHDFSKSGKPTEPEEFVWDTKTEKFEAPKVEPVDKGIENQEIDKFFTFNQKSEEFQKLLDKEYEKIQRSVDERTQFKDRGQIEGEGLDKGLEQDLTKATDEDLTKEPNQGLVEAPIEPTHKTLTEAEKLEAFSNIKFDAGETPSTEATKAAEMETARRVYFNQTNQVNVSAEDDDYDDDDDDDDRGGSGWGFGKVIVAFIVLLILIEFSMLGIKYLLPDTEAARVINDFQINVTDTVEGIIGMIAGGGTTEPTPDENPATTTDPAIEPEEPVDKPDPEPMADKTALVASAMGSNVNIKAINANESLSFNQDTNYKITDIDTSKPISNNIWFNGEDGKPVYYDQSLVGAVIAFDSMWIDFVNDKNPAVLEMTKDESSAHENVENFSKAGKIQEEFLLLEIGEIRQSEDYFYVWAHESIKVIENGKATTKDYKWVYQLQPVGEEIKIVNYCRF